MPLQTVGESKQPWSYFEKHAQEIWERNWMNPEMHTTLLNMKALRGQFNEDDQMDKAEEIAGLVPEIQLECEQLLKE